MASEVSEETEPEWVAPETKTGDGEAAETEASPEKAAPSPDILGLPCKSGVVSVITSLAEVVRWDGERDAPRYQCIECHAEFRVEYYCCPECDCYRVDRTSWYLE